MTFLLSPRERRVRRKLGDNAANPAYIETVRGVGYGMKRPVDA